MAWLISNTRLPHLFSCQSKIIFDQHVIRGRYREFRPVSITLVTKVSMYKLCAEPFFIKHNLKFELSFGQLDSLEFMNFLSFL